MYHLSTLPSLLRLNKSRGYDGPILRELDNLFWGRTSFVRLGTASCSRKHFNTPPRQSVPTSYCPSNQHKNYYTPS